MTYIPSSGGGGSDPVAFDADDLFCWQTVEDSAATSWPNRVPGGATATLSRVGGDATSRGGAPSVVNKSGELSYVLTNLYPSVVPSGASANVGPNNNFTIDWYMMPHGPAQTGGNYDTGHWVWVKLRQANSNVASNATIGMHVKYATAGSPRSQFMDWEIICRLTSGNSLTISPSTTDYPAQIMLVPHVLYHIGVTVALSGGNSVMSIYWNGTKIDSVNSTAAGTAVDWNTGFPWSIGLAHNGNFSFNSAAGRLQRLRVSNIVRPASYFLTAYNAIR